MISVKNLFFKYRNSEKNTLEDISFDVFDNEFVCILGHNGSGKSTLSKLLIGLDKPTSGSIFFDDLELNEKNIKDIRKKIGIVFQNPDNQFVGINVLYDIAFGLENHCVKQEDMDGIIRKWAKEVDMLDYLNREPETLSGGQKQRVAFASTLAIDVDIIILDEALSMLDPYSVKYFYKLINDLIKEKKKTVIMVTHDTNLSLLANRVIILKEGKIIVNDKPENAYLDIDLIKSTNLELPINLELYNLLKNDPKLKDNNKLMELLWNYRLKM